MGTDAGVELWQVESTSSSNELAFRLDRLVSRQVGRVALSDDGKALSIEGQNRLHLLKLANYEEKTILKSPHGESFFALSQDCRLAATWTRFSTNVQIWETDRSQIIREIPAHRSIYVRFSPDAKSLAVGDEVEYRIWDLRTWQSLCVVPRAATGFYGFTAYSPDSRTLAVAISRSTLRLINSSTGEELSTLEAPNPRDIHWISFNHDGTHLAAVNGSGSIQVWDLGFIRRQLASMKLDWEYPSPIPFAEPDPGPSVPMRITVETGTLVQTNGP